MSKRKRTSEVEKWMKEDRGTGTGRWRYNRLNTNDEIYKKVI
jgi:hypothetical protein